MCVHACMCVCVFGKERQNRTAVPGYSWQRHSEEQAELSLLRREHRDETMASPGTEGCSSPLTWCPRLCRCVWVTPPPRSLEERRGCRGGDETPCRRIVVLKDYEGAGRGFSAWRFSPSVRLHGRLRVEHLTAEGHSAFTCVDYYLSGTWADCCRGLLQVRPFGMRRFLPVQTQRRLHLSTRKRSRSTPDASRSRCLTHLTWDVVSTVLSHLLDRHNCLSSTAWS